MIKQFFRKWKLVLPSVLLLFLTACKRAVDNSGNLIEENIIRLSDKWNFSISFDSLIVYPLAQLINFFSQYVGVVGAMAIITVLVRLVTFRSTLQSQVMNQKMQALQPRLMALQEKYKGRTDQQAQMQMYAEQQNLYK